MISDKITVSDKSNDSIAIETALNMVEKTAGYCGYNDKEAKNLRLLAEEMVAGSAVILDVFDGRLWVQSEGGVFQILLEMTGMFTQAEREHLISLTRDNKNTMPKGFFGKLAMMLGNAITGDSYYPYGAMEPYGAGGEILWGSMQIAEQMAEMDKKANADPELSGIEKKIMNGLADDVIVSARPDRVTITVMKALPKR